MKTVTVNKFVISFIVFIVLALINAVICQSAFDVSVFEVFYSVGKTGQTVTDSQNQEQNQPSSTISTWVADQNAQNGGFSENNSPACTEANWASETRVVEKDIHSEDKNSDLETNPENFSSPSAAQTASFPQSNVSLRTELREIDIPYPVPLGLFFNGKRVVEVPVLQTPDSPRGLEESICRVVYPLRDHVNDFRANPEERLKESPEPAVLVSSVPEVTIRELEVLPEPQSEPTQVEREAPVSAALVAREGLESSNSSESADLSEPAVPMAMESASDSARYSVAKSEALSAWPESLNDSKPLESSGLVEEKTASYFGLPDAVDITRYGPPAEIPDCPEDGFVELDVPESEYVPVEERIWPSAPRKKEMYDFPKVED